MRYLSWAFAAVAAWTTVVSAGPSPGFVDQSSLSTNSWNAPVAAQRFRVLASDRVKGYAVRIMEPVSCEQGVQYSGYIDNLEADDHFFFYFFESRRSPSTDPLVLWLNGGPGCSSMMGLWMELGPCLINKDGNGTTYNDFSWNNVANVVFLDQPVNVGYSHGKSKISSSQGSAKDVYAFLQLFLGEFTEYAKNPFHISGESFGGHYLPALASEIIDQNAVAEEKGLLKLNLESMLIGNGWTDPRTQYKYYQDYGCTHDSPYQPIFDDATCKKMADSYPRCKMMMDACYNVPISLTCVPAELMCSRSTNDVFTKTGLNPYDIRKKCEGDSGLCYNEIEAITKYANRPEVRWELGVDEQAGEYNGCADSVGYQFAMTGDNSKNFAPDVAKTLEAGIRVLLYVGDMDWICNWYGNKAWSLDLSWHGQAGYRAAPDQPWYILDTNEHAGEVRSYGNLTFLRIFDAGHMVPYDQPANALDFFSRWLKNAPLAIPPSI
ncbi:Alpha/Beta hydrolase protein [Dichotomocladium elegans]|nr:Alpha/Beta hydrolase protein [Dichotomocladium elegans]